MRPLRSRRAVPAADPTLAAGGSAFWAAVLGPGLTTEIVVELQELALVRELPAGSLLVSSREPARELCLIARGDAALGSVPADGGFHPERSVHGPAWLDAASAWVGGMPAQDAVAVSDVVLITLPRAEVQALMQRFPELARRLVATLAQQVQSLTLATHDLMHKDAEGRFAAWLLQRCPGEAGDDGSLTVALNERKRDIASQLAITPETLSRLLRQLSRKGLIAVMGYSVKVLDLAELRALAGVRSAA
ncbi:Crp/Fnr family transcriptional regulator [Piscinibacter sp.]|uniref:Crp/Fnr family transcriptional regulator n=1 Tax=Piscinibacter sp. TaxID=1903157 RepID=UPI0039E57D39